MKVKNFGIWIRYDSRSGTHNMYKEYREMSRTDAVEALYQDMAARHRARFRSIHVLRVVELENSDQVKRPYIKQLISKDLKFPLPHRVPKGSKKIFSETCNVCLEVIREVLSAVREVGRCGASMSRAAGGAEDEKCLFINPS
jgi:ribosomal protein L20A (L18A)